MGTTTLCYLCCQRISLLPSFERKRQPQLLWWAALTVLVLLTIDILLRMYPNWQNFLVTFFLGYSPSSDSQFYLITFIKEAITSLATFVLLVTLLIEKKIRKFLSIYLGLLCLLIQVLLDSIITRLLQIQIIFPPSLNLVPLFFRLLGISFLAFATINYYRYLLTQKTRRKRQQKIEDLES
jgi:hypothetical protein